MTQADAEGRRHGKDGFYLHTTIPAFVNGRAVPCNC